MQEMKSAYQRIKQILAMFVQSLGEEKKLVELDLTHKELAFLVMSNKVTVTRILQQLEEEGFIKTGIRKIWVNAELISQKQ